MINYTDPGFFFYFTRALLYYWNLGYKSQTLAPHNSCSGRGVILLIPHCHSLTQALWFIVGLGLKSVFLAPLDMVAKACLCKAPKQHIFVDVLSTQALFIDVLQVWSSFGKISSMCLLQTKCRLIFLL